MSNEVITVALRKLRDMTDNIDRIMKQEGVPEEARDRVIHTIIFGTPEHPDTRASIKRGLADSAAGRVSEHPDFPWHTFEEQFSSQTEAPKDHADD